MTHSHGDQHHGHAAAPAPASAQLDIYPALLRTPRMAISIRNIARAAIVTDGLSRQVEVPVVRDAWFFAKVAAPLLPAGIVHVAAGWQAALAAYSIALAASVAIFFAASRPATKRESTQRYRLQLSTADGVLTSFASDSEDFAMRVLDIVCERMSHDGQPAPALHVNFERGTIEAHTDGAVMAGAGHGTQPGRAVAGAAGSNGASDSAHAASAGIPSSGHGKPTASDATAARPSGALNGGNVRASPGGDDTATDHHYVDFTAFLPPVVDMHRFYARQPNTEHLEQRLHELELLMRSGAPGAHQKARIRELSADLSQILQAYPPVVQIFQNISHVTGA